MAYRGHTPNFQNKEQYDRWMAQQNGGTTPSGNTSSNTPSNNNNIPSNNPPSGNTSSNTPSNNTPSNTPSNNTPSNNNNYYTPSPSPSPSTPSTPKPVIPDVEMPDVPKNNILTSKDEVGDVASKDLNADIKNNLQADNQKVLTTTTEEVEDDDDKEKELSKEDIRNTFTYNQRKAYGLDRGQTKVVQNADGTYSVVDHKGNEYKVTGTGADADFDMTRDWRDIDRDGDVNFGETFLAPFRRIGSAGKEGINTLKTYFKDPKAKEDEWQRNREEWWDMNVQGGADKFGYNVNGKKADWDDDGDVNFGERVLNVVDNIFGMDQSKQQKSLDNIASRLTTIGMKPEDARQYVEDNAGAVLILSSFGGALTGAATGNIGGALRGFYNIGKTAIDVGTQDRYKAELERNRNQNREIEDLYGKPNNTYSSSAVDELMPTKVNINKGDFDDAETRANRELIRLNKIGETYYRTKSEDDDKNKVESKKEKVLTSTVEEDDEDKENFIKPSDALLKTYLVRGLMHSSKSDGLEKAIKVRLLTR